VVREKNEVEEVKEVEEAEEKRVPRRRLLGMTGLGRAEESEATG
jgi:hypothetical protein